jgi:uncharacterized repeat protein (TIGR01451 family)
MTPNSVGLRTIVGLVTLLAGAAVASAQTVGAASSFAIVGGTTVTAGGAISTVNGDVGVSPGTSVTGFPSPATTVPPYSVHSNDGAAINAQAATLALYNSLAALGPAAPIPPQLNAQNLGPGTYSIGAADLAGGGTLTLTGAGNYVFQVASSLVANVGSQVVLLGGASACNVFWQVTSAATLNGVNFAGNVVAQANVTLGVGDQLTGRALATSLGSVTLSGGNSAGGCSTAALAPTPPAPTPRPNACATTAPDLFITKTHIDPFVVGSNGIYRIALGNNGVTSIGPITVTDTLPATVAFVSASGTGWTCVVSGQVVSCTTPSTLPGLITLTVTPGANAAPSVTNNAAVSGGSDCDLTNNTSSDIAAVATAVPTLSQGGLIALGALLAAVGTLALRRRSTI